MKKKMMEKQKGMTFISWIIVLVFVGFQFMLAIKIVPVYSQDHTVKSIWNKIENDVTLVGSSRKQILKSISKHMKINNLYDFDMSNVKIKKSGSYFIATVEYEPRGKIIGSLEFIVSFKHEAKIKSK